MTNITPDDDTNANSGDQPYPVFQPGQAPQADDLAPVDATSHVNANGVDRGAAADAGAENSDQTAQFGQEQSGQEQADHGQADHGQPYQEQAPQEQAPQGQAPQEQAPQGQAPQEQAAQEQAAPAAQERVEPLEPLAPAGSADAPVPLIEPEEPVADQPAVFQPAYTEPVYSAPAYSAPVQEPQAYDPAASSDAPTQAYTPGADAATMQQPAYEAPTQVYPQQSADPTYPAQPGYPVAPGYAQQPTYVQAPIPPKKKSNRLGGTLITLLGTLIFAVLYTGAAAVVILLGQPVENLIGQLTDFLMSWVFWAPVAGFTIVLVLIVLIVNNANWWAYVLGGFLVGVGTYFATIGGAMLAAQSWTMTADAGVEFLARVSVNPLTIASGLIAREVTIWIGAWISARGRKVKARNLEARAEFDRLQAEQPAYAPQPGAYQQPVGYPQA